MAVTLVGTVTADPNWYSYPLGGTGLKQARFPLGTQAGDLVLIGVTSPWSLRDGSIYDSGWLDPYDSIGTGTYTRIAVDDFTDAGFGPGYAIYYAILQSTPVTGDADIFNDDVIFIDSKPVSGNRGGVAWAVRVYRGVDPDSPIHSVQVSDRSGRNPLITQWAPKQVTTSGGTLTSVQLTSQGGSPRDFGNTIYRGKLKTAADGEVLWTSDLYMEGFTLTGSSFSGVSLALGAGTYYFEIDELAAGGTIGSGLTTLTATLQPFGDTIVWDRVERGAFVGGTGGFPSAPPATASTTVDARVIFGFMHETAINMTAPDGWGNTASYPLLADEDLDLWARPSISSADIVGGTVTSSLGSGAFSHGTFAGSFNVGAQVVLTSAEPPPATAIEDTSSGRGDFGITSDGASGTSMTFLAGGLGGGACETGAQVIWSKNKIDLNVRAKNGCILV